MTWWIPPIVVKAGSAFHQRWLWTLYNSNAKGKMAGGNLRPYGSPNVDQELSGCAEHAFPCHSHLLGKGRYLAILAYRRVSCLKLLPVAHFRCETRRRLESDLNCGLLDCGLLFGDRCLKLWRPIHLYAPTGACSFGVFGNSAQLVYFSLGNLLCLMARSD